MTSKKKDEKKSHHRIRENVEAVAISIIMAVMLKYFVVEAYKIPTGSMQPTLMGATFVENNRIVGGIYDRILVDKLSYHLRDPERFEVVVFKYPLDRSKNFIKRLIGIGPEELKISWGDLWNRPNAESDWQILRRPRPVQLECWKPLHVGQPGSRSWGRGEGAKSWRWEGDTIAARGKGSLRFPDKGSVMDAYRDGYDLSIRGDIRAKQSRHSVGDLRVEGEVEALPGTEEVVIEFREGRRRYFVHLPGPAADATARPRITAQTTDPSNEPQLAQKLSVELAEPWKLEAGEAVTFAAQNLDDLLSLELADDTVLELEIPSAADQTSCIKLRVEGEGADFEGVEVYRDIYYLNNVAVSEWKIPEGKYVMLGDNTQDSSDSREWKFARYEWPGAEGGILRGNARGSAGSSDQNPIPVPGGPQGTLLWFRDEWGELHHAPEAATQRLTPVTAPFVSREQITGRAVVVFWPLDISRRLWRLKWVH